jgi:outer membrane biosynthesis protein TonB
LRFIRSGIAASAIGHLSILAMVLVFTEVHPFGSVTAEPITVDLVSPAEVNAPPKEEVPPKPEPPKQEPSDAFDLSSTSAPPPAPAPPPPPAAAPQEAAAPPQKLAALTPKQTAPPPAHPVKQPAAAQPQPPATSPAPFVPPQPDLTVKYNVLLGLPPELPPTVPQDKPGDGFDAPASQTADIASTLITEFRRHLRTCSKLPASVAPSDPIRIKLRVLMAPDGKLAADPILIEASASAKGPALMQSAIAALEACQPYAMLPADRYGEWKVLDLSFTPQDFAGG